MNTRKPEPQERETFLEIQEDHFNEFKSVRTKPSTLQEAFVSFANSKKARGRSFCFLFYRTI